jgi:cellulose synthase/poly-beta-1,6-N-acetylglucosamine synthase-like glycosyltransferase
MGSAALLVVGGASAALVTLAAYLLVLSAAALLRRQVTPARSTITRRFAVLVPAHNEAPVIERLLRSLHAQSHPSDRFDVYVVADNCTDATAEIARRSGAIVHERYDPLLRAKGHALRWLLERVRAHGTYDAYVVFDADSEVAQDFLTRMDARLATGSLVVQSHYRVLNADASGSASLREAALASLHYLRPLGRAALGLSCGLKGNGMCFAAGVLDRFGWGSVGLAEDVELHLALVRHGMRTDFAPEAVVKADMPNTADAARSQNLRWEAGRLQAVKRDVVPMLLDGVLHGRPMVIDAAVEQIIPPLSVAVSGAVACAMLGAVLSSPAIVATASFAAAGFATHFVLGLVAVRAPARVYRALLGAPAYVIWKLALYVRAAATPASQPWVRTRRGDPGASPKI